MPDFFSPKKIWNRGSYSETVIKGPKGVFAALGKGEAGEGGKKKIITSSSL